jgi:hypothetical protein
VFYILFARMSEWWTPVVAATVVADDGGHPAMSAPHFAERKPTATETQATEGSADEENNGPRDNPE